MARIIHFKCRGCETELQMDPAQTDESRCPECDEPTHLRLTRAVRSGESVDICAGCGHDNLYIQKDFSRVLGMTIVVTGVGSALVLFAFDRIVLGMLALLAMALLDGALYLLVGTVTVCYSCHTIYRGFPLNPSHEPFNLELLERYGGRDPRH